MSPLHDSKSAPNEGEKQAEATVRPEDRLDQAARRILRREMGEFLSLQSALPCKDDVEIIHQMRVTTRRMRAAIRAAEGCLNGRLPEMLAGLRMLTDALGPVRDIDVFLEFLNAHLAKAPPEHQRLLKKIATAERRQRRGHARKLLEVLRSPEYETFRDRFFGEFLAEGQTLPAGLPVCQVASEALGRCLKKVRKFDRPVWYAPQDQHHMRIACKRLRYTAEFFADLYPDRLQPLRQAMAVMQRSLGGVHDADVFADRLRLHHQRLSGRQPAAVADEVLQALANRLRRQRAKALKQADSLWRCFTRPKPLKRLRSALANPCA